VRRPKLAHRSTLASWEQPGNSGERGDTCQDCGDLSPSERNTLHIGAGAKINPRGGGFAAHQQVTRVLC
jgi:hypothetical protein